MSTSATVTQYYNNVLQRDPTAAELSSFTAMIDSGALTAAQVLESIVNSTEAQTYAAQVIRFYQAAFGRVPDTTGINGWVDQLVAGTTTTTELAVGFVLSAEWTARYGGTEVNSATLTGLYQNVLGRSPSGAEIDAWIATGQSLDQVFIGFANSAEFQANSKSAVDALLTTAGNTATSSIATVFDGTSALPVNNNPGSNLLLTDGVDTITGTSGNDTITGDGTVKAVFSVADSVDGGAGEDTLKLFNKATDAIDGLSFSNVSNVENVMLNNGALTDTKTLDISGNSGITSLSVQDPAAMGDGEAFTFKTSSSQSLSLEGITGKAGGATSTVNVNGAQTLTVNDVDTDVTIDLTSTGSSLTVKTTGAASDFTLANTGAKLATLTLSGDQKLTLGAGLDFDGTKGTINASGLSADLSIGTTSNDAITFTGGSGKNTITVGNGDNNLTGNDKVDNFTVGSGKDTVNTAGGDDIITIGGNLTKDDTINGGDGTDTLITNETTIDGTDKTNAGGVSNVEVFGTNATADVAVDFDALSTFNTVALTGADTTQTAIAANGNTAGTTSVTASNTDNSDALSIQASRSGQHGQDNNAGNSGAGGDAINIAPKVDGGSNSFTIQFVGNTDIDGGDGGAATGNGNNGGNGGDGIDAALIETLNIEVKGTQATGGTADTVSITGGTGGTSGAAAAGNDGNSIEVEDNGKIVLTSSLADGAAVHNHINLGDVKGTNVEVDGSAFSGNITVTANDGNVTLKGGAGADNLTGGAGIDTISGGAGADTIDGKAGVDNMTGGDGVDTFKVNNDGNTVTTTSDVILDYSAAAGGDKIDMDNDGAVLGNKASTDVSGAVTGTTDLNATVSNGIITLSGSGVSLVDTVAELVDIFELIDTAGTEEFGAIQMGSDTYVIGIDATNNVEEVVKLTGVTGVTAISLTDAADTIFIA